MDIDEYLFRHRHEFTQGAFCERVPITPSYFSMVMTGKHIPSIDLAKRVEKATEGAVIWHEFIEWCLAKAATPRKKAVASKTKAKLSRRR